MSVETLTQKKLEGNDEVQQRQCWHSQSFSCLPALYISPAKITLNFPGNTLFCHSKKRLPWSQGTHQSPCSSWLSSSHYDGKNNCGNTRAFRFCWPLNLQQLLLLSSRYLELEMQAEAITHSVTWSGNLQAFSVGWSMKEGACHRRAAPRILKYKMSVHLPVHGRCEWFSVKWTTLHLFCTSRNHSEKLAQVNCLRYTCHHCSGASWGKHLDLKHLARTALPHKTVTAACCEHPALQLPSCSATSVNSHNVPWCWFWLFCFYRKNQLEE